MGLGQRRSENSCFCNVGCPAGTFPFRQYWVIASAIGGPDTGGEHWRFRFSSSPSPDLCEWLPGEDHGFPPISASLRFNLHLEPDFTAGHKVELTMQQLLLFSLWDKNFTGDDPPGGLVQPEAENSCSKMRIVLPVAWPVSGFEAFLTPAYPDACVDADWPEKEQRKPLAPF